MVSDALQGHDECHGKAVIREITGIKSSEMAALVFLGFNGHPDIKVTDVWFEAQGRRPEVGGFYVSYADGFAVYASAESIQAEG